MLYTACPSLKMPDNSSFRNRHPIQVQAWLVGSGIASLAAAVHLIKDAGVPGPNIHILDLHLGSGGEMRSFGDTKHGYYLPFQCQPHFHGGCIMDLLSLVPSRDDKSTSLKDSLQSFEKSEQPPANAITRALRRGTPVPEHVYTNGIQVGLKHRMGLIHLILESEKALGSKSIDEIFDQSFFQTEFWMLWSTTYGFSIVFLIRSLTSQLVH